MEHLRCTAGVTHFSVSLRPGREGGFRLGPMRNRSLIAPMEQLRHRALVGARCHEGAHAFLTIPGGHGPEGQASINQERPALKSRRFPDLPERTECMKYKQREKAERPDSQAG